MKGIKVRRPFVDSVNIRCVSSFLLFVSCSLVIGDGASMTLIVVPCVVTARAIRCSESRRVVHSSLAALTAIG
jgi:hypothetical protein